MEHLDHIHPKQHPVIQAVIKERLSHEPLVPTRNRKPLRRPNVLGDRVWELRCGRGNELRIFYDVDEEARTVVVLAIGEKLGSRLLIRGEEVEL